LIYNPNLVPCSERKDVNTSKIDYSTINHFPLIFDADQFMKDWSNFEKLASLLALKCWKNWPKKLYFREYILGKSVNWLSGDSSLFPLSKTFELYVFQFLLHGFVFLNIQLFSNYVGLNHWIGFYRLDHIWEKTGIVRLTTQNSVQSKQGRAGFESSCLNRRL